MADIEVAEGVWCVGCEWFEVPDFGIETEDGESCLACGCPGSDHREAKVIAKEEPFGLSEIGPYEPPLSRGGVVDGESLRLVGKDSPVQVVPLSTYLRGTKVVGHIAGIPLVQVEEPTDLLGKERPL